MKQQTTLRRALTDAQLLDMSQPSWLAWRSLLLAAMGEALLPEELEHFRKLTKRQEPPSQRVKQLWCVIGRRGGKSRAIAALAVYLAALCEHPVLARGERAIVLCIAPDREQSKVVLEYAAGLFEQPLLQPLIARRTAEELELTNGITLSVRTANYRRLRGFTAIAAIVDEIAFLHSEDSVNPDYEILNAIKPMLATTSGPLICISSPHARRGSLWEAFNKNFGADGDPAILVAQGETTALNLERDANGVPKVQKHIDRLYAEDPSRAKAEYGAEFRSDLEQFVSREILAACTDADLERPYNRNYQYCAFVDPSGGSSDSFTLGIAHIEDGIAVLDVLRDVMPPFTPTKVVADFCKLIKDYKIRSVIGDRYGGLWVTEQFDLLGITFEPSELTKSELYGGLIPMLNSRQVALLTNDRLTRQFLSLERRVSATGKELIDHPRNAHDDLANAAAGALVSAQLVPGAVSVANFNRQIKYPELGIV
jgi:hypothetical protein